MLSAWCVVVCVNRFAPDAISLPSRTLCKNFLAGRMPYRKHFALPAGKNSFSPRQTRFFLSSMLFTITAEAGALEICCGYLAGLCKLRRTCIPPKIGNSGKKATASDLMYHAKS
jgi:hypothetical protein